MATGHAARDTLGSGDLISDRYVVVRRIGAGAMGTVYEVRDAELDDEHVALKMLHPSDLDAETSLRWFRREVRLARLVTHPNVARTFDIGTHGARRFLTMELVRGEAMHDRLQARGSMAFPEVIRVALEIVRGLVAAHAVGVVHRDLKPANVLLAGDRVVVTDFGVACAARDPDAVSRLLVGTPSFMAPEQILGEELDGRADVHALGVLMYVALTGKLPFKSGTPEALLGRVMAQAPRVCDADPSVPAAVDELVARALCSRREDRIDSVGMLRRLEALNGEAGSPVTVRAGVPLSSAASEPTLTVAAEVPRVLAPEARRLFERGAELVKTMVPSSVALGIGVLGEALAIEPENPFIMSALALAMTRRWVVAGAREPETLARAEELCLRALAVEPTLGETFNTLGVLRFQQGALRAAIRAFETARARANVEDPYYYVGQLLCEVGRVDEGLEQLLALRAPSYASMARGVRSRVFALLGDKDAAERELEASERSAPVHAPHLLTAMRVALWWGEDDRYDDCLARSAGLFQELWGGAFPAGLRGALEAREAGGDVDLASGIDAAGLPTRQHIWLLQVATELYARGGADARVLEIVARLAGEPFVDVLWLDHCPMLARFKGDPNVARWRTAIAAKGQSIW